MVRIPLTTTLVRKARTRGLGNGVVVPTTVSGDAIAGSVAAGRLQICRSRVQEASHLFQVLTGGSLSTCSILLILVLLRVEYAAKAAYTRSSSLRLQRRMRIGMISGRVNSMRSSCRKHVDLKPGMGITPTRQRLRPIESHARPNNHILGPNRDAKWADPAQIPR